MIRVYEIHCCKHETFIDLINYDKVKKHFEKHANWDEPIIWEADDKNKIITIAIKLDDDRSPSVRLLRILQSNLIAARAIDLEYLKQFKY